MVRQVFWVIVYAYIFPVCLGLYIFAPDWLAGGRQQSSGGYSYGGLSLLNSELGAALVKTADMLPGRVASRVAQPSHTVTVHAGETLIKWPPSAMVVHTNMGAVHADE